MSDELTELPEGWEWVTFSEIITKIKRGPSKKCNTEGRGVRYITSGNLQNGELRLDLDYKFLDDLENIDVCRLKAEDLILNCVNSLERIGKSAVFEQHHGDAIVGFNNYALELRRDCISSSYANICCQSELFQKQLYFLVKRAINQVSFATKELSLIKIPLPPLNEQKRIVAKIEELRDRHQAAKQALEAVPELCDRFRQSVLAAAFRGDLTADWREENPDIEPASVLLEGIESEHQIQWEKSKDGRAKYQKPIIDSQIHLPELPIDWCWVALDCVANAIDPHPSHRTPPEAIGGVPYISIGDLSDDGTIDFESARRVSPEVLEEHRERYRLQVGDFIFGKIGTLGKPFRLTPPFDYTLSANVILIQTKSSFITNDWLYYFLKSPFIEYLLRKDSRATSQAAFGIKRIRSLPIPIPSIQEQKVVISRIENYLSSTVKFESIAQTSLRQIEYLNQSILAKAFRGELVEQDSNDEPASVLLERIRAERETTQGSKTKKSTKEKQRKTASKVDK